jgi:hypothetical protein
MSKAEALAAVTATLHSLLKKVAGNNEEYVTVKPPSAARPDKNNDQLNIFLYNVRYNPAFRNEPMPGKAKNGEISYPPMPLILKYIITAYGKNDDDISAQEIMGRAMSILHDHPVLSNAELKHVAPEAELHEQAERIRITPDFLTLDDMSKLWSSFQSAEYRLSVGYEISVVLIDSTRSRKAPLPVLKRGEEDRGANVLSSFPPSLSGLRFPNQKPAAELGDTLILLGEHLTGENTTIRLQHPLLKEPVEIAPGSVQDGTEMTAILPNAVEAEGEWPAGFYLLSLVTKQDNTLKAKEWVSNQVAMPLAPKIISVQPQTASPGDITLTINCAPQIRKEQKAVLLFGDRIIPETSLVLPAEPVDRTELSFTVNEVITKSEPYTVRIRVDGVDSIPVDFSGGVPKFDSKQQVTIS